MNFIMTFMRLLSLIALLLPCTSFASVNLSAMNDSVKVNPLVKKLELAHLIDHYQSGVTAIQQTNTDPTKLDKDLVSGFGNSLSYHYHFEPAYQKGYYLREDGWTLKEDLGIGVALINSGFLPLYIDLRKDTTVTFIRNFHSELDAATALPKTIFDLPNSSAQALAKLAPGDFVAIPAQTTFIAGPRFGFREGWVGVTADMVYTISGEFVYQVFRVDESHFRVRIYARKGSGVSGGVQVDVGPTITGLELGPANHLLKLLKFELFEYDASESNGHILLVDYMFDLGNADAQNAFNALLQSVYAFNDVSLASQVFDDDGIDHHLANMALADDLAFQYENSSNPPVRRLFSGDNAYTLTSTETEFNILIATWRSEDSFAENFITTNDLDGNSNYYYNPSFVSIQDDTFLWNTTKNERVNIFAVLNSDVDASKMTLHSLGASTDTLKDDLDDSDQKDIRTRLYRIFPDAIYNKIDWKNWNWGQTGVDFPSHQNWRLYLQMSISGDALHAVHGLTQDQVEKKIVAQLSRSNDTRDVRTLSDRSLIDIADTIYSIISDSTLSDKDKVEKITDLKDDDDYRAYNIGFFAALLDPQDLAKYVTVRMQMFADDADVVAFGFGSTSPQDDEILKELHLIDATSDWQQIDTRMFLPPNNLKDRPKQGLAFQ